MKKFLTLAAILAIVGLIAFRLINNKKEIFAKTQVKKDTDARVSVNVVPVQSRISAQSLRLVGTVTANQVIDIKPEVQGQLVSLNVNLGDHVRKGQVVARVDDRTRALSVTNAEQVLADARTNLERYRRLYEGGAVTRSQLEQFQLNYNNAEIQLAQARKELSNAIVKSPISGQITQKLVESGSFVNIGASIATVVDVSSLKIELNVSENDVYALKVGDPVQITAIVYPGVNYQGRITFISPNGDEAHNYPIEISLTNQKNNPLKAGTYVDVTFNRKSTVATLQIPREALVGSIREAQVYVVNNNNTAQLRPIAVGADYGTSLEVIKGLKEGEKVVTTGQINLINNTPVSIIQ